MAMIKCPECSKDISDKAASCPNCGVPINQLLPIPVIIERKGDKFSGAMFSSDITIDGQYIGAALKNTTLNVDLYPGHHQIIIETSNGQSECNELDIPKDAQNVYLRLQFKSGWKACVKIVECNIN